MNKDCLFCKIASGEITASIIYKDEHTVAFLDVFPRTEGHTLVIPRFHAPTIITLPEAEIDPLFRTVKSTAKLLSEKLACEGITIGINQGRASGQEVDHIHVHLMPRWSDDSGSSIQSVVNKKPEASLEETLAKILVG